MQNVLKKYHHRIDRFLADYLSFTVMSKPLLEAMRYSVLSTGKRLRPSLVYLFGEPLGVSLDKLDQSACAVELIHTYSLIHDDLPMMDNDDWRRGNPSCHKMFSEAIAVLAGNALQTLAFEVLLQAPLSTTQMLATMRVLAKSVGVNGIIGGQAMEFSNPLQPFKGAELETIYRLKTGALFAACLELAGIIANISVDASTKLVHLGYIIGLIYQLQDDIEDGSLNTPDSISLKSDFQNYFFVALKNVQQVLPPFRNLAFVDTLNDLFVGKLIN